MIKTLIARIDFSVPEGFHRFLIRFKLKKEIDLLNSVPASYC